ncbi:MAG: hypothetical protein EOP11_12115 [Proteobacteria bacterium]|nr:MAG: hypothetical protein EOP11_12115 [Pseudomonadota bacterium]
MNLSLESIELDVRAGRSVRAREALREFDVDNCSRAERLQFANLCRRSSDPSRGLAALRPAIRPPARSPVRARPEEKVEYAACLQWLGLVAEAEQLLQNVEVPGALLERAFLALRRWSYEDAIGFLERYLAHDSLSAYERLVGRVNLLAALVHERHWGQAESELVGLRASLAAPGLENLRLNCLKQELEMAVERGQIKKVNALRAELENAPLGGDDYSKLFLAKWLAVVKLRADPAEGKKLLAGVRQKALDLDHFETLRDCDAQEASVSGDPILSARVFQGTPYVSFRNRFALHNGGSLPAEVWVSFADSISCEFKGEAPYLEIGGLPGKLLSFLHSDFYVAPTVPQIFGALFPYRHYHEIHGPNLVHQALFRLRRELVPFGARVEERAGRYYFRAETPWKLLRPGAGDSIASQFSRWEMLDPFSTEQLAQNRGWSLRKAQRFLKDHAQDFRLMRLGRNLRYSVKQKNQ